MAAVHLDDSVGNLMVSGDIDGAVRKYIENIVSKNAVLSKTSSATTKKLKEGRPPKSLKLSAELLKKIPVESWNKFDEIYKTKVVGYMEGKKPTERTMTKGAVLKVRGGDDMIVTSGQRQKVIKDDIANKVLALIKEQERKLEDSDDNKEQADLISNIEALHAMLEGLHETRKGRAILKGDPEQLKKRYKKIESEFKKKNQNESTETRKPKGFKEIVKELAASFEELERISNDPEEKAKYNDLMKKLKSLKFIKEETRLSVPASDAMLLIKEGVGYNGVYFPENYIFSSFVKAFYKDSTKYGLEEAEGIYEMIYGEDISGILSYLKENEYLLEKLGTSKSTLLFEGYGNVERELTESLWSKLKLFGAPVLGKVKNFLSQGLPWAKDLISKGAAFFTELSIAQIAVPAIALAGGVAAGLKLVNSIRKKMKANPLSKEEKEKFKKIVMEKEDEIKKYL